MVYKIHKLICAIMGFGFRPSQRGRGLTVPWLNLAAIGAIALATDPITAKNLGTGTGNEWMIFQPLSKLDLFPLIFVARDGHHAQQKLFADNGVIHSILKPPTL
jgi:hypothetical protein